MQGAFLFAPMIKSRILVFVFGVTLLLLALVYVPGLRGGFFFDDNPNIVDNGAVHLRALDWESLRASLSGPEAGPFGRPISVLSFALTHFFFGLDPFAFKAINLVLHGFNGALVGIFVFLLLGALQGRGREFLTKNCWLALWVAAVWLLHPMNTIPILLAVQRMTLLAGTFCLLALICHVKAVMAPNGQPIQWGWLVASWFLFWPLSMLSKETGLLFPLFVLIISIFQRGQATEQRLTKRRQLAVIATCILLLCMALSLGFYWGWDWLSRAYITRPFTLAERLMTEARVLWFYAFQIVLPDYERFATFHDDFVLSTDFTQPLTTWISVVAWCVAILAIVIFRSVLPVVCFAGAWFLGGHSLESTFLPLELVHEYRNYLPSIGLILGSGWLGMCALRHVRMDHTKFTTGLVGAMAVALCTGITWTRASQLGDPLNGPQIEAERHSQSARANHAAAVALFQAGYGDKDDPIGAHRLRYYLIQASKVDSGFKLAPLTLIIWACASERLVEDDWVNMLEARLEHTAFSPQDNNLPEHLLRPLVTMPKCLPQQDALKLFAAPVRNSRISNAVKSSFVEAAADYELLVSNSPKSARSLLQKAALLAPHDTKLAGKLKSFEAVHSEEAR